MAAKKHLRVAGLGQCSLDHIAFVEGYPEEDTKMEAKGLFIEGGGPVATALVALSRLGVETSFAGVVSDDGAGVRIIEGLKAEGVGTRGLKVRKGGSSQVAFIIVNSRTGSRTIIWKRPSSEELKASEVGPGFLRGKDFLLIDGLMYGASRKAALMAKKSGVPVMLDAGRLRPGVMDLAGKADYLVCSEEFSRAFSGSPEKALKKLSRLGPRAVTITLGSKGSVTWSVGRSFRTPAFRVRAVDTTGAGDVFHGGYIYGLLMGWGLERTVRFASAFAALKCLAPGGRSGIPGLKETLSFMENRA